MKSIVIVNPNRYTGYSYITYAKTFLTGYNLIGLWTTSDLQTNFKTSATIHLNEMIIAEDITYDKLVDIIKTRNPVCFMVGDDSAFSLADRLQNYFFPNHSNDISLYEKRVSKNNYLEYLHQKNLVASNQYNIGIDNIPNLDFNQKYILKPINGAGNENVFIVKSIDTIKNVLNTYTDTFVLQDYIEGEEYCMEMSSFNGIHKCTMASIYKGNYLVDGLNPWREENELVSPDDPNIKIIYEYVSEILTALGVRLGMSWTQIKINNGNPHLIEINFRSQGHGIFQFIHKATGSNYASESFKSYLKIENIDMTNLMYKKIGDLNKICVNNITNRYIESVEWNGLSDIKSNIHIHQYARLPNIIPPSRNFKTTIGMIILQNNDKDQYLLDYQHVKNWKSKIEQ
jgi:predicted ATP-grasp superfamily ATP-dependent carboligase